MSDIVEQIKSRVDIIDYISRTVTLARSGRGFVGLCPFHNEKTPSFHINPSMQRFKCFGCDKSGDVITFRMLKEGIEFKEALSRFAYELGIKIIYSGNSSYIGKLQKMNIIAQRVFLMNYKQNRVASEYMSARGFLKETIDKFGIGYGVVGNLVLEELLKSGEFKFKELYKSGLIVPKDSNKYSWYDKIEDLSYTEIRNEFRDKFVNRVIFPIYSESGKIVGFSGRTILKESKGPKYLNSPETVLFKKNELLYGLYNSIEGIRKLDEVVILEGQMDVVKGAQFGISNLVAPLGTALTEQQLLKLSKITKNIVFFYDNDEAGYKALERSYILGTRLNINMFCLQTKDVKDFDELLDKNPQEALELIKRREDALLFLINRKKEQLDLTSLEGYRKYTAFVSSLTKNIDKESSNFYKDKLYKPENPELKRNLRDKYYKYIYNYIALLISKEKHGVLCTLAKDEVIPKRISNLVEECCVDRVFDVESLRSLITRDEYRKDIIEILFLIDSLSTVDNLSVDTLKKKIDNIYYTNRIAKLKGELKALESLTNPDYDKIEKLVAELNNINKR